MVEATERLFLLRSPAVPLLTVTPKSVTGVVRRGALLDDVIVTDAGAERLFDARFMHGLGVVRVEENGADERQGRGPRSILNRPTLNSPILDSPGILVSRKPTIL